MRQSLQAVSAELSRLGVPSKFVNGIVANAGQIVTSISASCETRVTRDGFAMCKDEQIICAPEEEKGIFAPVIEEGLIPYQFYSLMYFLLFESLKWVDYCEDNFIWNLLNEEVEVMEKTIVLHNVLDNVHDKHIGIKVFQKELEKTIDELSVNGRVLLNVGSGDHSIYLEFFKDEKMNVTVNLYNLGDVHMGAMESWDHRYGSSRVAHCLQLGSDWKRNRSWGCLNAILTEIITAVRNKRNFESLKEIYSKLYALISNPACGADGVWISELVQTTNNCTWKGYAFYLTAVCARIGIPRHILLNHINGAAARLLVYVETDQARLAYNLMQLATGSIKLRNFQIGIRVSILRLLTTFVMVIKLPKLALFLPLFVLGIRIRALGLEYLFNRWANERLLLLLSITAFNLKQS